MNRQDHADFYWQSSAAGLLLGTVLGLMASVTVSIYLGVGSSAEYFLALFGVLVGATCGAAAGVAGTVYSSLCGRPPPFLLTTAGALLTTAGLPALVGGLSGGFWAYTASVALPASVALGLALPPLADRLGRRPSAVETPE